MSGFSKSHRSRELETTVVVASYEDARTKNYELPDCLRIVVGTFEVDAAQNPFVWEYSGWRILLHSACKNEGANLRISFDVLPERTGQTLITHQLVRMSISRTSRIVVLERYD